MKAKKGRGGQPSTEQRPAGARLSRAPRMVSDSVGRWETDTGSGWDFFRVRDHLGGAKKLRASYGVACGLMVVGLVGWESGTGRGTGAGTGFGTQRPKPEDYCPTFALRRSAAPGYGLYSRKSCALISFSVKATLFIRLPAKSSA